MAENWYKIGGKVLNFKARPLIFNVVTTDGEPYQINFDDGGSGIYASGSNAAYMYSGGSSYANFNFSMPERIKEFETSSTILVDLDFHPWVNLERLSLPGTTFTIGDISSLPTVLNYFRCAGQNTVSGDVSSLPNVMTYFRCEGQNTVSGDISSLPNVMYFFRCEGQNTVNGDISSIPSIMNYFTCAGQNTVSGDIALLPIVMTNFRCSGQNTVSGDIALLPIVMTNFSCDGGNTVSGNISSLPSVMTDFFCGGKNTVSGNISGLPSVMTYFFCYGLNTVGGDISSLPNVMYFFRCVGQNTIDTYTYPRSWTPNMNYILINQAPTFGLSSIEVDNLLIDLSATSWIGSRRVDLRGANAPRSTASNTAVALLVSKGVTVLTN